MVADDFEPWVDALRQQRFDISLTARNLLCLAANFQSVLIKPLRDSELEVTIDAESSHRFLLPHAAGKLRMILARISAFYTAEQSATETALYGFQGKMEISDEPGTKRLLAIDIDNRIDFHFSSKRMS